MNLDFNSLIKLLAFLDWVLKYKEDPRGFVAGTRQLFRPYYDMHRLVGFCDDGPKVIIPETLATRLNSLIMAYGFEYTTFSGEL